MKTTGLRTQCIFLLGLLLAYSAAFGAKHIEKTFRVGPGGTLTLKSDLGSIRVTGEDRNTVRVNVDSDHDLEEILELDFSQEGDEIIITGRKKRISLFKLFEFKTKKVNFTIAVPGLFNVDLKTSGGGIEVSSIQGQVNGSTSGGSVSAEEITGQVDVHTSGGKVSLREIDGPVNARTSGGGIQLNGIKGKTYARTSGGSIKAYSLAGDATLQTSGGPIKAESINGHLEAKTSGGGITITGLRGSVYARTSGGGITATLVEPPGADCELRTSGGGIKISLPRETNAYISARTSGGSVNTDLPVTVVGKVKRSSLEGNLGSGGPGISLKTSGGSIHIKASD